MTQKEIELAVKNLIDSLAHELKLNLIATRSQDHFQQVKNGVEN